MGNPIDLEALDSRLWDLLGLLEYSEPLPDLAAAVRQFVQDYTSEEWGPRSLFRPDWEEMWGRPHLFPKEAAAPFAAAWIHAADGLDDRQKNLLTDVCVEAARFLKDSDTPLRKEEYAGQLRQAVRDYLDVRGYDVSSRSFATGTPGPVRRGKVEGQVLVVQELSAEPGMFSLTRILDLAKKWCDGAWEVTYCRTIPDGFWQRTSELAAVAELYHVDSTDLSRLVAEAEQLSDGYLGPLPWTPPLDRIIKARIAASRRTLIGCVVRR